MSATKNSYFVIEGDEETPPAHRRGWRLFAYSPQLWSLLFSTMSFFLCVMTVTMLLVSEYPLIWISVSACLGMRVLIHLTRKVQSLAVSRFDPAAARWIVHTLRRAQYDPDPLFLNTTDLLEALKFTDPQAQAERMNDCLENSTAPVVAGAVCRPLRL